MSKYIIELDYDLQRVVGVGVKQGTVWVKDYDVDDLEELCDDYIRKEYRELPTEAYKRGYDYGLLKGKHDAEQDMYDKGYQKGFEEGKGAIHAGREGCQNEGAKIFELPCSTCRNAYPNHWTAKKKEDKILIGDVVKLHENGENCIVTALNIDDDDDMCVLMTRNGGFIRAYTDSLHKTGKHFDLVWILKEMDE